MSAVNFGPLEWSSLESAKIFLKISWDWKNFRSKRGRGVVGMVQAKLANKQYTSHWHGDENARVQQV